MKRRLVNFARRYFVPRRELDVAVAHRDAIRDHFAQLQKEYLELESRMMSQTGYVLADVDVNIASIDIPAFPHDQPFCWRVQCQISRESAVVLRENVKSDLLPYIAENFKRTILKQLSERWPNGK